MRPQSSKPFEWVCVQNFRHPYQHPLSLSPLHYQKVNAEQREPYVRLHYTHHDSYVSLSFSKLRIPTPSPPTMYISRNEPPGEMGDLGITPCYAPHCTSRSGGSRTAISTSRATQHPAPRGGAKHACPSQQHFGEHFLFTARGLRPPPLFSSPHVLHPGEGRS